MTQKKWNWQQPDWPNFTYDKSLFINKEKVFLEQSGILKGICLTFSAADLQNSTLDILTQEAYETSEIEGEILNRESLRLSLKKHLGYPSLHDSNHPKEYGIAEMMADIYNNYALPLSHKQLFSWHDMLMNGRRDIEDIGNYRTHKEAMHIVSGDTIKPTIHFTAPPSTQVTKEMEGFMHWFNSTSPDGKTPIPALIRASIAHLYFVCIHPFEDGNGRIARALVDKILSTYLRYPALLSISSVINQNKKSYYKALESQNTFNQINDWLEYFTDILLKAQENSIKTYKFWIKKIQFFDQYGSNLNTRQEKALQRIFKAGYTGFKGGMSAKKYIAITQTSHSTATRDLNDLVKKGILTQTGTLKATRYWLR